MSTGDTRPSRKAPLRSGGPLEARAVLPRARLAEIEVLAATRRRVGRLAYAFANASRFSPRG